MKSMVLTLRAALAVGLLAGFYGVGFALVAGLGWLSVWLLVRFPGQIAHDVGYLCAVTAVALVVPLAAVLRTRPEPVAGAVVTREQAPELWAVVQALACSVGTRAPDEIRLFDVVNAGVWEDARLLGLRGGRRYLYIGVPLLQALSVAQLRAVLGHELGHYSHHHTRLGAMTYRGLQTIGNTIERAWPASLTGLVLDTYAAVYLLVSAAVTRRTELEADRIAVRIAGRATAACAIREVVRVSAAWEYYRDSYVGWVRHEGYTPAEFLAWFRWLAHQRRPDLQRAGADPGWTPFDTHPPHDQRIAMIEREPDQPADPDPRPAADLFADPEPMYAALRTDGFDEFVERVTGTDVEREADRLYRALPGGDRPGIDRVLASLGRGQAAELAARLDTPPEDLTELVVAAAGAAMVASGAARWRHRWGEPVALVSAGSDESVALRTVVAAACADPAAVAHLRAAVGAPAPLEPGPVFAADARLVADDLFLLSGDRLDTDVLHAGLAAAVLADLRRLGRVVVERGESSVRVVDVTATGHGLLDGVLDRLVAGGNRPVYRWLQALGPDVTEAVRRRARLRGLSAAAATALARKRRTEIVRALRGAPDRRALALAALLWGTELTRSALGWAAWRVRLRRIGSRDGLAIAVRTVIGLHMPLSGGGGDA
jgi:Zn-dependent protease with chaperone function